MLYLHHIVEQSIKTLYCSLLNSSKVSLCMIFLCYSLYVRIINIYSGEIIISIPLMILHALKPVQQYGQLEGLTMEMESSIVTCNC